jgi:hypothetical protein
MFVYSTNCPDDTSGQYEIRGIYRRIRDIPLRFPKEVLAELLANFVKVKNGERASYEIEFYYPDSETGYDYRDDQSFRVHYRITVLNIS